MESINPKAWEGLDMGKELTRALSAIDDARAEYGRSLPKISTASDGESDPVAASAGYQLDYRAEGVKDFNYWLKAGFAFTLPLFGIGVILVIVIISALK